MFIGREKQQQELLNLLQSDESQFCAIYGRRRIGKTYLVMQTFNGQFAFVHSGLNKASKEEQLWEFRESLRTIYWSSISPLFLKPKRSYLSMSCHG